MIDKKLLPYILMFAAILLLAVDIRIPVKAYPVFEPFVTEAPQTVDLVVNHVIGHNLMFDLLPDVLGYLLLAVSCVMLGPGNRHFFRQLPWIAVSLGFYLCQLLMPFSLNGGMRFRAGYLLYFISGVLQVLILMRAMLHVCDSLDTTENHTFNNLSIIFMIISCFAGVVVRTCNQSHCVWSFLSNSTLNKAIILHLNMECKLIRQPFRRPFPLPVSSGSAISDTRKYPKRSTV